MIREYTRWHGCTSSAVGATELQDGLKAFLAVASYSCTANGKATTYHPARYAESVVWAEGEGSGAATVESIRLRATISAPESVMDRITAMKAFRAMLKSHASSEGLPAVYGWAYFFL